MAAVQKSTVIKKVRVDSVADEWRAGCCSRMTFSWLFPLIRLGYGRQLKEEDIGENFDRDLVEQHLAEFEENLKNSTKENIRSTIWKTFSRREYYAIACKFTSDLMGYIPPLCISFIVSYAEKPDEWGDNIWFAAAAMLVAPFITGLCNHWFYQFVMIDGLHARTTIQAAVYSKVLRISNAARTRSSKDGGVADTITNLQSTDCRSVEMVYWMWMYCWAAPLQAVVTTVLLYMQLGWPIFVGIFILLLMTPIQKKVMGSLKSDMLAASKSSDERIKLITEIIQGVQVVKLQAWEDIFAERVETTRATELKHRRAIAFLKGANTALTECAPIISTIVTFAVYGLVSPTPLTAVNAFTALSLFNILRLPLMVLPMLIGMIAGGTVAAKRLGDFLYSPDLKTYVKREKNPAEDTGKVPMVEVKSATLMWEANRAVAEDDEEAKKQKDQEGEHGESNPFRLVLNDLTISRGTLTVVAGKVGSGKSSLLAALLGEMMLIESEDNSMGSVTVRGSVSYCAQEPWIQNATVRENIVFGSPFNQAKYEQVLKACALEADIAALPGGDLTEIGERGINLSGGQKARVTLGRACYADSDVIILDDILSAVDAHVARTITDECLVKLLRDQGKTVVLATHQTLCFPDANTIVLLKDGAIAFQGEFSEAKEVAEFAEIVGSMDAHPAQGEPDPGLTAPVDVGDVKPTTAVERASSVESLESMTSSKDKGKLTTKEKTEEGAVTLAVYRQYARMVGVPMCFFIMLLVMSVNGNQVAVNWWLSRWSVSSGLVEGESHSTGYYLTIYFILGMAACFLIFAYQIAAAFGGLGAAAGIHNKMFTSILHAPMSFFDTTPSGQILNRFTADMKSIDEQLISQLSGALSLLCMMLSVLITMVVVVPYILIALVPLFVFYGWIQRVYRNTARELKRFDSATQSPVFNYFAETVNGLSSVRAFGCEERLLKETKKRVDYNSRFWTKNNFVNRWLGLRLDWIGAALVGCTALACVLAVRFKWPVDAGLVGLVLSYTATLTGLLNWGVRRFSEAEMGMVAVERTRGLTECPQEFTVDEYAADKIPPNWPPAGEILVKDVSARYREGLPKVLKRVNLHIPKGTTVGICGRTGSGKTTLGKCLFRLMEIAEGCIEVDGLDISRVGLATLRKNITMIPQDPTLFAGPLRYSLDPANNYTDDQLWQALDSVDMKVHVETMENKLDADIVEGGENLSAGQRQLLCMARALLETPKVLIMDEATSNIDGKTDNKIQTMLKEAFKDCTVLTIAHRIDTILWYDKVLVMDHGTVLEYDSPTVLSKKGDSEFKALLDEYRKGREERG